MAEQPPVPASRPFSPGVADPAVINTVVRRLGLVALQVFNTVQSNLVSNGREQYAEALNDSLKPLVDCLLHFDILDGAGSDDGDDDEGPDTEVDDGSLP